MTRKCRVYVEEWPIGIILQRVSQKGREIGPTHIVMSARRLGYPVRAACGRLEFKRAFSPLRWIGRRPFGTVEMAFEERAMPTCRRCVDVITSRKQAPLRWIAIPEDRGGLS